LKPRSGKLKNYGNSVAPDKVENLHAESGKLHAANSPTTWRKTPRLRIAADLGQGLVHFRNELVESLVAGVGLLQIVKLPLEIGPCRRANSSLHKSEPDRKPAINKSVQQERDEQTKYFPFSLVPKLQFGNALAEAIPLPISTRQNKMADTTKVA
jgi:hypothetical protein